MRYIKTIRELTNKQRVNWLQKNNPNIVGTRRNMGLEEWLDSIGVPKYRTCSYPLKDDYPEPTWPVDSNDHMEVKMQCQKYNPMYHAWIKHHYRYRNPKPIPKHIQDKMKKDRESKRNTQRHS